MVPNAMQRVASRLLLGACHISAVFLCFYGQLTDVLTSNPGDPKAATDIGCPNNRPSCIPWELYVS